MNHGDPVTAPQSDSRAEPAAPAPPAVVSGRFTAAEPLLRQYAQWLAGAGSVRGLIGPREVPRIWERHILNSLALAELLPVGARLVDIGTGAGLPGLAVACIRPDMTVDLVESLRRRTDFLSEAVEDLGLAGRVRVVRGRAEDSEVIRVVGSSPFVTARAVAPLDKLVRWSFPLLVVGGRLLAMKGDRAEAELVEHAAALRQARATHAEVVECGAEWLTPPTRVISLVRSK
jgi:16S rRNA (guanine527-N7)-methyltransferase